MQNHFSWDQSLQIIWWTFIFHWLSTFLLFLPWKKNTSFWYWSKPNSSSSPLLFSTTALAFSYPFCTFSLLSKTCCFFVIPEMRNMVIIKTWFDILSALKCLFLADTDSIKNVRSIKYVCTERIFNSRSFMYNKTFLRKFL